jgi:tetratricopeptide (TPR) repeat protein
MIIISNHKKLFFTSIVCFLLILEVAIAGRTLAANPQSVNSDSLFREANALYEKAEYAKAVQTYLQLTAGGYESGNLHFNLGNAYFKQGQKGLAILYYEKARRFIPFDPDLRTNLNLALAGVDEGEINWGHEFYRILACLAPLNQLTVASSICFYILILLMIILILFPAQTKNPNTGRLKLGYKTALCFVSGLLLCLVTLTTLSYLEQRQIHAVAVKNNINVRNEPNSQGTVYFNLAEGSRVLVSSTQGDWYLIKRQDGKRGWVERQYLGRL